MSEMIQAARVAIKLDSVLQAMRSLHGDQWGEKAAPYRAAIQGVIAADGCSVLDAAIPIAKAMSDADESPVMLLAVAAEMCEEEG